MCVCVCVCVYHTDMTSYHLACSKQFHYEDFI